MKGDTQPSFTFESLKQDSDIMNTLDWTYINDFPKSNAKIKDISMILMIWFSILMGLKFSMARVPSNDSPGPRKKIQSRWRPLIWFQDEACLGPPHQILTQDPNSSPPRQRREREGKNLCVSLCPSRIHAEAFIILCKLPLCLIHIGSRLDL